MVESKRYATITEIKAANKARSEATNRAYWFDAGAMRFFGTRIEPTIYGGRVFVTSEAYSDTSPRRFAVRECLPSGEIGTIGNMMQYSTKEAAIAKAKRYVGEGATLSAKGAK